MDLLRNGQQWLLGFVLAQKGIPEQIHGNQGDANSYSSLLSTLHSHRVSWELPVLQVPNTSDTIVQFPLAVCDISS